ncbi:MAG: hypothetical protein H0V97_10220 [Actinobacteria bacterium]|nr:hypothetical protein [Actinomycetota bacterium]
MATTAIVTLAGVALAKELRTPPERRRWHGSVAGLVPYDFRRPTVARFRKAWWNPSDERVLTERDWGVGWAVNLPSLARFVRAVVAG